MKNAASELLASRHYQYDKAGNITQIDSDLGKTEYGYDPLDRLTKAAPDQKLQDLGLPTEQYQYDAVHNRTFSGHQVGTWSYNADNQLTSYPRLLPFDKAAQPIQTQVEYTPQGHTARESGDKGERAYSYNAAERLIRYASTAVGQGNPTIEANYRYDPLGRRISKEVKEGQVNKVIYFFYSDTGLLGEADEQGQMTRAYAFNPQRALQGLWSTDPIWQAEVSEAQFTNKSTRVYYLHTDHLGTPVLGTSKQGEVTWKTVVEAFGVLGKLTPSQMEVNLRYPGQYFDEELGGNYNFYREYSPIKGRYDQVDPIGLLGGDNIFSYSKNNPLNYYDSYGLSPGGSCCEKNLSDEDCCFSVMTADGINAAGIAADGTVVCCQGRKVACVSIPGSPRSTTANIMRKCTLVHEEKHFDHIRCPQDCGVAQGGFNNGIGQNDGECESYVEEIKCLKNSLSDCAGSPSCIAFVEGSTNSRRRNANNLYGCNLKA